MKKMIAVLAAAVLGTLVLVGCQTKTSFFALSGEDDQLEITCENSEAGSSGSIDLTVEEGDKFVFDATELEKGKLQVDFKDSTGKTAVSVSVSAKESKDFEVPVGAYTAEVSVLEEANGNAEIEID